MGDPNFLKRLARFGVPQSCVKRDRGLPSVEDHFREAMPPGLFFRFNHHQPSYALTLPALMHGDLTHLHVSLLPRREHEGAEQHLPTKAGQVKTVFFAGQLGFGEFKTQGLAEDVPPQGHAQGVGRGKVGNPTKPHKCIVREFEKAWWHPGWMRIRTLLLLMALPAFLCAQDDHSFSYWNGDVHGLIEVHQITPGPGIRDANSRGGWGGQLGVEAGEGRFVLEAGEFPAQLDVLDGSPSSTSVFTLGMGLDYLYRITDRADGSLYLLAGVHLDSWSGKVDTTQGRESNNASHLGLRFGVGLRLGPLFGEVRYRLTEGDIRVSSAYPGRGGGWSGVEVGMGVRF